MVIEAKARKYITDAIDLEQELWILELKRKKENLILSKDSDLLIQKKAQLVK